MSKKQTSLDSPSKKLASRKQAELPAHGYDSLMSQLFEFLTGKGVVSANDPQVDSIIDEFLQVHSSIQRLAKKTADLDPNYLEQGTDIEHEHKPTYELLEKSMGDSGELPAPVDMYESIAKDHLREHPEYYDKSVGLPAMEDTLKNMEEGDIKDVEDKDVEHLSSKIPPQFKSSVPEKKADLDPESELPSPNTTMRNIQSEVQELHEFLSERGFSGMKDPKAAEAVDEFVRTRAGKKTGEWDAADWTGLPDSDGNPIPAPEKKKLWEKFVARAKDVIDLDALKQSLTLRNSKAIAGGSLSVNPFPLQYDINIGIGSNTQNPNISSTRTIEKGTPVTFDVSNDGTGWISVADEAKSRGEWVRGKLMTSWKQFKADHKGLVSTKSGKKTAVKLESETQGDILRRLMSKQKQAGKKTVSVDGDARARRIAKALGASRCFEVKTGRNIELYPYEKIAREDPTKNRELGDAALNTVPIKSYDIDRVDGTEDSINPDKPIPRNIHELGSEQVAVTDFVPQADDSSLYIPGAPVGGSLDVLDRTQEELANQSQVTDSVNSEQVAPKDEGYLGATPESEIPGNTARNIDTVSEGYLVVETENDTPSDIMEQMVEESPARAKSLEVETVEQGAYPESGIIPFRKEHENISTSDELNTTPEPEGNELEFIREETVKDGDGDGDGDGEMPRVSDPLPLSDSKEEEDDFDRNTKKKSSRKIAINAKIKEAQHFTRAWDVSAKGGRVKTEDIDFVAGCDADIKIAGSAAFNRKSLSVSSFEMSEGEQTVGDNTAEYIIYYTYFYNTGRMQNSESVIGDENMARAFNKQQWKEDEYKIDKITRNGEVVYWINPPRYSHENDESIRTIYNFIGSVDDAGQKIN